MRHLVCVGYLLLGFLFAAPLSILGMTNRDTPTMTAKELHLSLAKARDKHDIPALAAAIVRGTDKPVVAIAGVRKRGTESPPTENDHWHLGSNTKPITAFLIALLIELGLLDWDTPLEQIFPEYAEKWNADLKSITPAHLLTHTSGLPSIGPIQLFLIFGSKETPAQDRASIVKSLSEVKLSAKPGVKYDYSNLGYVVLGAIIDRRGKASWEEQIEKRIFQPLGIKQWGLGPLNKKDAESHPWPHATNGKPVLPDGVMDNPAVMNSAGRVRMSVTDYNKFLAETLKLARGEMGLLKAATAKKLYTSPNSASPHSLSGWVGVRKKGKDDGLILGHDGSNTFNYCTTIVMPERNFAICVMSNQGGPGGPGHKACGDILKEVLGRKRP